MTRLRDVAGVFLKLGTVAFGGPAAHIAMMEDECVRRRQWLTHQEFLDFLGATNLIPGPNSTELAIHVGRKLFGWRGLVVAGAAFILPAALIVTAIAWLYTRYGALPAAAGFLYGVKPVVIVVVFQALWRLARTSLKTRGLAALGAAATAAAALGVNELAILLAAGMVMVAVRAGWARVRPGPTALLAWSPTAAAGAAAFGLWPMFAVFLKIGSVLFGSGYVLLAFLRADFVQRLGWLSERQLLDAVAVGQFTPGPVFTTATFIGYVLGGSAGAVVATLGIFLPAFVFVALSSVALDRLRTSPVARAALDGVNVASLALMAVVTWYLGRAAFADATAIVLAGIAAVLLLRFRFNSAWLVLGGGLAGVMAHVAWPS